MPNRSVKRVVSIYIPSTARPLSSECAIRTCTRALSRHTAAVLAEELLDVVRSETGRAGISMAEPPVRLSGGYFTENNAFRLEGAEPPWDGPLVVRLFPSEAP